MSLWKIRGCVLYLWSGKYYILWRFTQYKGRIVVISPIVRFFELNSSSDSPGLHHILTVHRWGIWIWSYTTEPRGNSPLENSAPVIKNTFSPLEQLSPDKVSWHPRVSQMISRDIGKFSSCSQIRIISFSYVCFRFRISLCLIWTYLVGWKCYRMQKKAWVSKWQKDWESFEHIALPIFLISHCKDFHILNLAKQKQDVLWG